MNRDYYVYRVYHNRKVCYIGKGKTTRIQHVNSGHSSNPKLNELHRQGVVFDVDIYMSHLSNIDALRIERKLIKLYGYSNLFNKCGEPPDKTGTKLTQAHKDKIRKKLKNKPWSKLRRLKFINNADHYRQISRSNAYNTIRIRVKQKPHSIRARWKAIKTKNYVELPNGQIKAYRFVIKFCERNNLDPRSLFSTYNLTYKCGKRKDQVRYHKGYRLVRRVKLR